MKELNKECKKIKSILKRNIFSIVAEVDDRNSVEFLVKVEKLMRDYNYNIRTLSGSLVWYEYTEDPLIPESYH